MEAGLSPEESLKAVNHYSRDNTRTPFQWSGEDQAGFTAGTPWLKVNPNYHQINAREQEGREDSVLSFYKKLIKIRKDPSLEDALVYGRTEAVLEDEKDLMAYFRRGQERDVLVLGNFREEKIRVSLSELEGKEIRILLNNGGPLIREEGTMVLEPLQAVILEIQ